MYLALLVQSQYLSAISRRRAEKINNNALDNLFNFVGDVVFGNGQLLHFWRLHPHLANGRYRGCPDSGDSGSKSDRLAFLWGNLCDLLY
jgi:hypothetical protein